MSVGPTRVRLPWRGGASAQGRGVPAATGELASLGLRALRLPWYLSLRWRLTLAFTGVLGTMLVVFSLVTYWYFGRRAMDAIDRESALKAGQVEDIIHRKMVGIHPTSMRVREWMGTTIVESGVIEESFDPFDAPGIGVRLLDVQANPVYASNPRFAGVVLNNECLLYARQGRAHAERLETGPDEAYYILTRPVLVNGRPLVFIQILTALREYDNTMSELKRLLVLGTLFAVGMSLLTGAALAQTAIAPIDDIAHTAERINRERDLGRRIARRGPSDEIGRLAETINEMLDRIEGMFDRQRRFLADVSHELRTPLTTIRGEVELAQRTGSLDAEALESLCAESQRMSRLIDDLLMLARADSGADLAGKREPVSLGTLVLDVQQQAMRLARGSHEIVLDRADDAVVLGDRDRLKQLLLNLVANALRHTPPGTRVALGLAREDGAAVVTVADDGPGIPSEDLPNLFDRFYRVDKARSRAQGGSGLGLAIVRSIAEAHGGTVSVASTLGAGTTFAVRLPLAPA